MPEQEPREGVDYLVNYYAVLGVDQHVDTVELKSSLNEQIKQNHPDRLDGLAPDIVARGERISKVLNKARGILLDSDKRQEYDEILNTWEGPVSESGIPVVTLAWHQRSKFVGMTAEEVDKHLNAQDEQMASMLGFSDDRLLFLEEIMAETNGSLSKRIRSQYEEALDTKAALLAAQQAERAQVLGIHMGTSDEITDSLHLESTAERLATARITEQKSLEIRSIGGVSTRLELLAGDTAVESSLTETSGLVSLPDYYDEQSKKVVGLAEARVEVLQKRLDNLQPVMPLEELQVVFRQHLLVGIDRKTGNTMWLDVDYGTDDADMNIDTAQINPVQDERIVNLLKSRLYREVIEAGYGISIFKPLNMVDVQDTIVAVMDKYIANIKKLS